MRSLAVVNIAVRSFVVVSITTRSLVVLSSEKPRGCNYFSVRSLLTITVRIIVVVTTVRSLAVVNIAVRSFVVVSITTRSLVVLSSEKPRGCNYFSVRSLLTITARILWC